MCVLSSDWASTAYGSGLSMVLLLLYLIRGAVFPLGSHSFTNVCGKSSVV